MYFFIERIRPICRTLGIREYIITVVHCMHIVLLSPLLGATGGNFIIGSPFEVYWGRNCITGALYGATGAPFLLLECLLSSTVAPIVLPKRLSAAPAVPIVLLNQLLGTTDTNFLTEAPF